MYSSIIKNIVDFFISLTALLILLPVIIGITLVLYLNQKTFPYFFQLRVGNNNNIFNLIKFKTMNDRRDKNGMLLPDKARLTRIGKFIRSTSLDELPQLINVLKGDMSLIGPRPLLVKYLDRYSPEQAKRHNVKPGITGWAQVNGRNSISWERKFELDVFYVEHQSFMLDLKILFLTLKKVFFREGINAGVDSTMEEFKGN